MYLTPTNMHGITILLNTYIHLNAYTCTVLSLYNSAACSPLCPRLSKINPVSSFLCLLQRVSVLIRTTAHFPHFPHLNMHQFDYLYIFFKNDPFHFFSVYEIFLDTVHKLKGKHCVSITYCVWYWCRFSCPPTLNDCWKNRASLSATWLIICQRHLCTDLFLQCISP